MIPALLFLLVPGALASRLLGRAELLRSSLARAFAGWFVGECVATFAVYGVAVLLVPWTTGVLKKAAWIVLVAASGALAFAAWRDWRDRRSRTTTAPATAAAMAGRAVFLAACAAFAFFFYRPHLLQTEAEILRSPIYWDFSVHAPIVQSFVHGDNFPAGNESFAGAPLTYHFFFDLLTAVPTALGVRIADAFLLTCAASLFALLGLLAGFAEELAGGPAPGILAALFAVTSGSLRFLDAFRPDPGGSGWSWTGPFTDAMHRHPYLVSFVPGNPFAYNGTMFNLFYFLEERQLVFASGFLLAAVLLLTTRRRWSYPACAAAGVLFGAFVFWHLFVTVSLGLAIVWLLAFEGERRKTAAILAAMGAVGVGFLLWVGMAMRPEWFLPGERAALRWNFAFSTVPGGPPFSLPSAAAYWLYAWGGKAVLGGIGLVAAFRGRRTLFLALASVIVPTFLLVNAVQIVPLSVYDNHKWLRPMSLFLDLAAGYALVLFVRNGNGTWNRRLRLAAAAAMIPLVTLSGVIEGLPFFASSSTVLYARYPTRFTADVRGHTAPQDVFASFESNALHLAGRKLFVGNDSDERGTASLVASAGFDAGERQHRVFELYAAPTRDSFCRAAADDGIDWLEVEPDLGRPSGADARAPGFDTLTPEGRAVRFLDVRGFCSLTPLAEPR